MSETNKKYAGETETMCVATMIAMNALLLAVIGGVIWTIYSVFKNADFFDALTYGKFFPQ